MAALPFGVDVDEAFSEEAEVKEMLLGSKLKMSPFCRCFELDAAAALLAAAALPLLGEIAMGE